MKDAALPDEVHRVGRRPDPFAWPDWSFAAPDGTFGNRFDDPLGTYRVLYAATERSGAYVETLARFRPDPAVFDELTRIDAPDDEPKPPRGVIPAEWFATRAMGVGQLRGRFVELGAAATLGELRPMLAPRLVHYGIVDLDASAIRMSVPRHFTQEISRVLFERTGAAGDRVWDGIAYASRLGDDLHNWATFEPNAPQRRRIAQIEPRDPALHAALQILGLEIELA